MWRYFPLLLLMLIIFSCQNDKTTIDKQNLAGQWQLVNVSSNQKVDDSSTYKRILKQLILTTSMDINPDGTIVSYIWGSKQKGYWQVKGDNLIVTDRKKRETFQAKIVKLNEKQLILYHKRDSVHMLLYFRKDLY